MLILLDSSFTLIKPSQPVGLVYAQYLNASTDLDVDPDTIQTAFQSSLARAPSPDYALGSSGHVAEVSWWRSLVLQIFSETLEKDSLAAPVAKLEDCFDSLFEHYAQPASWTLYPETVSFLKAASEIGPLAVVSNFDDRLAPILNGLGIGCFFREIITSADALARKPDRKIFDFALNKLNCPAEAACFCGDSHEADYLGASSAGIRSFHLKRPADTLIDFLDFCRS